MNGLALGLFAGPLLAAALSLSLRAVAARLWVARLTALGMIGASLALVVGAANDRAAMLSFGGWMPPFGIGFRVDRLSALFVLLLSLVLFATVSTLASRHELSSRRNGEKVRQIVPASLFLSSALTGAFFTSDIFNLFVMFELVLVSSYLLLQASGRAARRASAPYVTMNVLASLLFFSGIGVLYALGGSLSLPHLATALAEIDTPWKTTGVGLLTLAFATKAGMVPLMFWLPQTYPRLLGPVAALFAGMMTKLGVYALLRIVPLMAGTPLGEMLVWGGAASALLAVLAAQAQTRLRDLLSFHVVSQVGFMIVGIGLATLAGITGAVLYVGHHVLVKTALFLIVDEVEPEPGSLQVETDGHGGRGGAPTPFLVAAFLLSGLSLAGMPPLSGFLGKLAIFQPLVGSPRPVIVALLLAASFFTLTSVLKIWRSGFVESNSKASPTSRKQGLPLGVGILVAASLVFVFAAGPIYDYAHEAAARLLASPASLLREGEP